MPASMFFHGDSSHNDQTFYCPNCGNPLTVEGAIETPREVLIQVACQHKHCKVYRATTVIQSIASGVFQDIWKFRTKFNYQTGEPIHERHD